MSRLCSYIGRMAGVRRETLGTRLNGEYVKVSSEHVLPNYSICRRTSTSMMMMKRDNEKKCIMYSGSRGHITLSCRVVRCSSLLHFLVGIFVYVRLLRLTISCSNFSFFFTFFQWVFFAFRKKESCPLPSSHRRAEIAKLGRKHCNVPDEHKMIMWSKKFRTTYSFEFFFAASSLFLFCF